MVQLEPRIINKDKGMTHFDDENTEATATEATEAEVTPEATEEETVATPEETGDQAV
ncbi:MAG: hypothetical protein WC310_02350 [Patescibacteria group bacterium]|jgi:hypothetical protein